MGRYPERLRMPVRYRRNSATLGLSVPPGSLPSNSGEVQPASAPVGPLMTQCGGPFGPNSTYCDTVLSPTPVAVHRPVSPAVLVGCGMYAAR